MKMDKQWLPEEEEWLLRLDSLADSNINRPLKEQERKLKTLLQKLPSNYKELRIINIRKIASILEKDLLLFEEMSTYDYENKTISKRYQNFCIKTKKREDPVFLISVSYEKGNTRISIHPTYYTNTPTCGAKEMLEYLTNHTELKALNFWEILGIAPLKFWYYYSNHDRELIDKYLPWFKFDRYVNRLSLSSHKTVAEKYHLDLALYTYPRSHQNYLTI